MSNLKNLLQRLKDDYSDYTICIRGDKNANKKNIKRSEMFYDLLDEFAFHEIFISHPTYHHFIGEGMFDSNIDTIAISSRNHGVSSETIDQILCRLDYPEIGSHHDIILSSLYLSEYVRPLQRIELKKAPRTDFKSVNVNWTPDGTKAYSIMVSKQLADLRNLWFDSDSKALTSVFIQCTNDILINCSTATNPGFPNGATTGTKPKYIPTIIKRAKRVMNNKYNAMCRKNTPYSIKQFRDAQKSYKKLVRHIRVKNSVKCNAKVYSILSSDPRKVFNYLRKIKGGKQSRIESLRVGNDIYTGNMVGDGFFRSMSSLKYCDEELLAKDPAISHHFANHNHLIKHCASKTRLPNITFNEALSLLKRMKAKVSDIYGISPLHYLNGGEESVKHFQFVLNEVLSDIEKSTVSELNTACGRILYKGHHKDKNIDKSYRTISTCPVLAKALDLHLRDLYQDKWNAVTAETQYQTLGSSHELASLLVTEMIQYSLNVADSPIYLLILDAQSAFDRCLRQVLSTELFMTGMNEAAIKLVDNRLKSRCTVYHWDNEWIGPSRDITGFEQGGINSGDFYKLYNNEQLNRAQASSLGVDIGSAVISGVGQADDVILSSNDLHKLGLLAKLNENYCKDYRVKQVSTKTKLLAMYKPKHELLISYAKLTNQIKIDGTQVEFVNDAEHVGVLRSTHGNMPNILQRISSHKKALASIGCAGMSKSQRVNPAANIRIHNLYAVPILFSGLASLVLNTAELKTIAHHYKNTIQGLQRLHEKTPKSVVYLLGGCLPAEAILHIRQLSLFSMICLKPDDPLHKHGVYILSQCSKSSKSWFFQIHEVLSLYGLETPLHYLTYPPNKIGFKNYVKKAVISYWHSVFIEESKGLRSLKYFKPELYSLTKPHYMWTTTAGMPYETSKSTVLARMMSGRFRTEMFCRYFSLENKEGYCTAPGCNEVPGTLEHVLVTCPALNYTRERMYHMCLGKTVMFPSLHQLVREILVSDEETKTMFFIEPLAFDIVKQDAELIGGHYISTVSYLTRTFVFCMYRDYIQRFQ